MTTWPTDVLCLRFDTCIAVLTLGRWPLYLSSSAPTKRRGRHVRVGAEERSRELRAQGAQIDAAARAAPRRRHLEAVREGTNAAKSLGLVWVVTPSYSITAAGLKKVLE